MYCFGNSLGFFRSLDLSSDNVGCLVIVSKTYYSRYFFIIYISFEPSGQSTEIRRLEIGYRIQSFRQKVSGVRGRG